MIKTHECYYPLYNDKEHFIILVTGGRGSGKCLKKDTLVMMSDLTIKPIQDIKVGEKVMGDDGKPRNVLQTSKGFGDLYKVSQKNAEDYVVNEHHILTLRKKPSCFDDKGGLTKAGTYRRPNGRYPQYGEICDIPILEYIEKSDRFKSSFYGVKSKSIPYPESEVKIPPYLLGLWLGDGTSIFPNITNPEPEVKDYLEDYCNKVGLRLSGEFKSGAYHLRIVSHSGKEGANTFLNELRDYNLIGNKHIPQCYIANSESVRLELLAGLLDTDGHFDPMGDYEITQKSEPLAKQIKFLADTLGFRTKITAKSGTIDGEVKGTYYRVYISGDINRIPCKVERKKAMGTYYEHRSHLTSKLTIAKEPEQGEWYGIGIDGNNRYLLADGTITHNSFSVGTFLERLTFEKNKLPDGKSITHNILSTRYTMTSASISVIPEFLEKVEADGTGRYFHSTKTDVTNLLTGAKVMFRGIKTSSGNQTAKLKSIQGITTFVCDEAEEWTSEKEFETIMFSIRQQGIQNRIVVIMNPSDSNHFIYQKYIKDTHKLVEYDGVPVQISTHPNVLHIHTSYLDNIEHLSEEFLKEAKAMKETNPERYAHIFMGQWSDVAEGAIFKKWGIVDEFPKECRKVGLGIDWGYTCLVGDTLISTKRGEIPIKDVKPGDYVLTRKGYQVVLECMDNGIQDVVEKEIIINNTNIKLEATESHKLLVNGTWKKYGELTQKDNLCVLSNLTERCLKDTQTVNTQTITIASGRKRANTIKSFYTTQCTNSLKEKSQTEWSYITLMRIHSTITLKTLLHLRQRNTEKCTTLSKKEVFANVKCCAPNGSRKRIGTKGARKFSKNWKTKKGFAKGVEIRLRQQTPITDSVATNAIDTGNSTTRSTLFKSNVPAVENCSHVVNIQPQNAVLENVQTSFQEIKRIRTISHRRARVYNLHVNGYNEFFANGILVHNCDPTAIVRCGVVGNRLYVDEECYETGMLSVDIIKKIKSIYERDGYQYKVIADSADPRLIQEVANGGILIYPVMKGPGSILAGIDKMQTMELFVTKRSIHIQEEWRNYTWDKDMNGNYINQPIDAYNHATDGIRYYVNGELLGQILLPKKIDTSKLGIF